jgi:hypothetical protein
VTRNLAISKRQAQTLLRAAEAEKAIVEVKVGDTTFRLIPASLAQADRIMDDPESFDTFEQYAAWRDRQGAGEVDGNP